MVVAAFNQERFIGRCLRSLLHQTISHDEYEIVVVDDGSTDRTPYALELFHDAITTISSPQNEGLPAALNRGILNANAPLIVRVDADDFVNRNFINFLRYYLETNPDSDAVACDYLLLDDKERVLGRANCSEAPIACGIMFRRNHLIEIGLYDEQFRRHEERDLRIRFEQKYKIDRLAIPLYRYRRHDSNITNDSEAMERFEAELAKKHGMPIAPTHQQQESP